MLPSRDLAPAEVVTGTVVVGAVAVGVASQTDQTGPILAFVGAILVALVTAYWANRRQKDALVAEAARLDAQLRHAERLQDLADLRTVLEHALRVADRMWSVQNELSGYMIRTGKGLEEDSGSSPEEAQRVKAVHNLFNELDAELSEMGYAFNALQIRLDQEHAVVRAYGQLLNAASEKHQALGKADEDRFEKQSGVWTLATGLFFKASRELAATKLADPA